MIQISLRMPTPPLRRKPRLLGEILSRLRRQSSQAAENRK